MAKNLASRAAALLALAALLAGCAQAPTLRSVLKDRYPGYDQVLPAESVQPDDLRFDYIPGTITALLLQEPRTRSQAAVWANDGIYCPPGFALSGLRPVARASTSTVYEFDFSLRRLLSARKVKSDLKLEENEIEFLRRVTIDIANPRIYSFRRGQPPVAYLSACTDAIAHRPDLFKIRSIAVGDVRVGVEFKDNVSLLAKFALFNKIRTSFGFGYVQGDSYTLVGEHIVFGVRLAKSGRT